MEIKQGQIWQEVDKRFTRFIKIVDIGEEDIFICTVDTDGYATKPERVRKASAARFNGKRSGYKFVRGY